jgi:hypothetical protein
MGYQPDPVAQRLAHGTRSRSFPIIAEFLFQDATGLAKLHLIQNLLLARGFDAPLYFIGSNNGAVGGRSSLAIVSQICATNPLGLVCHGSMIQYLPMAELKKFQSQGGIVVCYDHPS